VLCFAWAWIVVSATAYAAPPEGTAAPEPAPVGSETDCTNGLDDDGDIVFDCGDNDCKAHPACQPDGGAEDTEARCADWVDNDEDGYLDCEDIDCQRTRACMGSWDLELAGAAPTGAGGATGTASPDTSGVRLEAGQTEEDLIAQEGDAIGESDNVTCSDGVDNDNDGRIDCDDLSCRLNSQVTVCQPATDFRFSVVARVNALGYELQDERLNTEFDALQLRALGQMPFIQNSFFLISARVEKTPRVVFAMFQVPLGKKGHYVNINSGGGGLSLELVRSVHKRLLADPAFYVYNAFEQGNGAAVEFGGPIDKRGKFLYRTFLAGGSGRFAGNIGGTFFPDNNTNYTWAVGAQAWMNIVGYYNRWDNPFMYTPSPLAIALALGAKFDQRAQERYPAANAQFILRWSRIMFSAENYSKRELVFKNWQTAYNLQLGILAWSKRLMVAGDFGQYFATDFENPPEFLGADLRRQLGEMQYRAAVHLYLWRDVFYATAIWRDRRVEPRPGETGIDVQQDVRLLFTYRW
jgi:hypothetical protein